MALASISAIKLFRIALVLAITIYLLRQVRKPSKWTGRPFLWLMNRSHSNLTDWGLQHVEVGKGFTILDVGCGGGRTIQKLAGRAPAGKVYGIDYAQGSVSVSSAKNAELISQGRVFVMQASVAGLPFPDNSFDLVTAVETQYYWPNLEGNMKEVWRVLKPDGSLMVLAEAYKNGNDSFVVRPLMKWLGSGYLSVEEQRKLFSNAGYYDVEIFEGNNKKWICVVGRKRASKALGEPA